MPVQTTPSTTTSPQPEERARSRDTLSDPLLGPPAPVSEEAVSAVKHHPVLLARLSQQSDAIRAEGSPELQRLWEQLVSVTESHMAAEDATLFSQIHQWEKGERPDGLDASLDRMSTEHGIIEGLAEQIHARLSQESSDKAVQATPNALADSLRAVLAELSEHSTIEDAILLPHRRG